MKINILLVTYLFCFSQVFSQARVSNHSFDEKKETKTIHYWAIKMDLMEIANGTYSLGFEKSLNESFTLTVYGGVTGKNYLYNLMKEVNIDSDPDKGEFLWKETSANPSFITNRNDYYVHYLTSNKYGLGYAIGISPTFYFIKDPSEGAFVNFLAMYKRFSVSNFYNDKEINESQNRLNLTLNFGRKQPISDKVFVDFSIGAGLAFVNDPKSVFYTSNLSSVENLGTVYWSPTRFHAQLGIIVGYNKY